MTVTVVVTIWNAGVLMRPLTCDADAELNWSTRSIGVREKGREGGLYGLRQRERKNGWMNVESWVVWCR